MRVLHVVGSMDPRHGGPTEVVRLLCALRTEGDEAEVATLDDPAARFLQEFGVPVHALGGRGGGWYHRRFEPWLRAERGRFDVAVVHGLWEQTGWAVMRALHGRVPYLLFPHGMLDPWFKRRYPRKHLKKLVYWWMAERWVMQRAARVVFTTELEQELAAESFGWRGWRGAVAPLGTEGPVGELEGMRAAFWEKVPEVRGRRFVLFLGRIDPKKGCDLLLEGFARVAGSDPGLMLVIAGPDERGWSGALRELAARLGVGERVIWPGMLGGEVKWGALAAAEVFALPSHQENFGMAAVEALACGTPVLLARPVNLAPELEAAECALVEEDTVEGVTRMLGRWMGMSGAERTAMRGRAKAAFEERYRMGRNAERIFALLRECVWEFGEGGL